jgi:hypothetical protein
MSDCTVFSADFSNTESIFDWSGNKFYATEGNILMSGILHNIKDSEIVAYGANNISLPDSLINCLIIIPAITTTRATTISGGKVIATTISAGADLQLLNTDIGAADVTMADATELIISALKSSGTVTLDGSATKAELDNVWNNGVASDITATAWNYGEASGLRATAWGGGATLASGVNSTAWDAGKASGEDSTAWDYGEASARDTTAWNYGKASAQGATAWNDGEASGLGATAFTNGTATGPSSLAFNYGTANGHRSTAAGTGVYAQSFLETALGRYNTDGAATSTSTWEEEDKLFSIGNGTSDIARADALVIYKSGKAKFQNILNLTPLAALPDPADSDMGDMVVKNDGTIWFFDGTDWGSFDITVL